MTSLLKKLSSKDLLSDAPKFDDPLFSASYVSNRAMLASPYDSRLQYQNNVDKYLNVPQTQDQYDLLWNKIDKFASDPSTATFTATSLKLFDSELGYKEFTKVDEEFREFISHSIKKCKHEDRFKQYTLGQIDKLYSVSNAINVLRGSPIVGACEEFEDIRRVVNDLSSKKKDNWYFSKAKAYFMVIPTLPEGSKNDHQGPEAQQYCGVLVLKFPFKTSTPFTLWVPLTAMDVIGSPNSRSELINPSHTLAKDKPRNTCEISGKPNELKLNEIFQYLKEKEGSNPNNPNSVYVHKETYELLRIVGFPILDYMQGFLGKNPKSNWKLALESYHSKNIQKYANKGWFSKGQGNPQDALKDFLLEVHACLLSMTKIDLTSAVYYKFEIGYQLGIDKKAEKFDTEEFTIRSSEDTTFTVCM